MTLPDGVDACDIGTITVWCQPFRAIFTRLAIPRSTFVRENEREREKREREREEGRGRGGGGGGRESLSSNHVVFSEQELSLIYTPI